MAYGSFFNPVLAPQDQAKLRIDYASATITYYGFSAPGALTSDAVWEIRRETLDGSSRTTQMDWADANANADNVWDNRASLSYS